MKTARLLALAASLALAAPSLPAFAQNTPTKAQQQEAATRFKKGLELFKEADYQAALIEFRRANELAPNFNVLYNIGQVHFQLQDYPSALNALERYLKEGDDRIPSSRKNDVQRDIDKLRARVANIEIVSTVPDAEITIDDVAVGKSPLPKPILVSAGRHKITISKSGFTSATKVIEIASAETAKVPLDPAEIKTAPPPDPAKPPDQVTPPPPTDVGAPVTPAPPPPKPVPVAGIVVTGVLAAGAVVMGVLALNASGNLANERMSPTATREGLNGARDKTTAFALVSDILTGGAVVAAGVTLYVGLSGPSSDKKAVPAAAPPPAAGLSKVRIGFAPGGIKVIGAF
jgi:hypothetical protein